MIGTLLAAGLVLFGAVGIAYGIYIMEKEIIENGDNEK